MLGNGISAAIPWNFTLIIDEYFHVKLPRYISLLSRFVMATILILDGYIGYIISWLTWNCFPSSWLPHRDPTLPTISSRYFRPWGWTLLKTRVQHQHFLRNDNSLRPNLRNAWVCAENRTTNRADMKLNATFIFPNLHVNIRSRANVGLECAWLTFPFET